MASGRKQVKAAIPGAQAKRLLLAQLLPFAATILSSHLTAHTNSSVRKSSNGPKTNLAPSPYDSLNLGHKLSFRK